MNFEKSAEQPVIFKSVSRRWCVSLALAVDNVSDRYVSLHVIIIMKTTKMRHFWEQWIAWLFALFKVVFILSGLRPDGMARSQQRSYVFSGGGSIFQILYQHKISEKLRINTAIIVREICSS